MSGPEMDRRAFVRAALLGAAGSMAGVRGAAAARDVRPDRTDLRIGAVLPETDTALHGVRFGAAEAEHAARLFGTSFSLHEARPGSDDVARLFEPAAVHVLIGGATADGTDALIARAERADILFMNVGTPFEELRRACSARAFHVAPALAMLEAARRAAGAPADARVVAWHASLARFGAAQVSDRYRDMFDADMDGRAWAAWMAVKIVFDAAQRVGTASAAELAAFLTSPRAVFDGHKGVQLSFRPDTRQLRQPLYVLSGDAVTAEVPTTRELGDRTHAELLDTIGLEAGPRCGT